MQFVIRRGIPVLVIALLAASTYAQRPEKVAQALRDRYPNAQTEIVGTPRDINGVNRKRAA